MPEVFATGYMVGLIEWICIQAVNPHIDWPLEQTVGTHINVSHSAATPPGMQVRVKERLTQVEGRRLVFDIEAQAKLDTISKGIYERFVISAEKFGMKATENSRKKTCRVTLSSSSSASSKNIWALSCEIPRRFKNG